ncbi:exopolysaccharide biosynthesis WecB/TagA/CpsF family protein [Azospirillum brasilense]|uniref:Exopolysaccharide biosynthesis WecB/TagA/CpsF family protein n=1 Tax=Azospirillum brasilense TaxID=192 RepID=A0A560BJJ3_AZOBR|nr:WecB/TagA/CpsF family glycosyltransferase [Azospirillum brasilense]TWA72788.1 exopolysaccharide biosynthesis WecB/TagA/CpsF family protein [Azospirillum brasilense]
MIDHGKKEVLGVYVNAVDYEAGVRAIIDAAEQQKSFAVSALAVHGVMTGALDPEHRYRLNAIDLVTPDGQPVRWALNRLHGAALPDRVYGPNLMLRTCAAAAARGLPIYLYGATAGLLDTLTAALTERFPGLIIAGARPSAFRTLSAEERAAVDREIIASGARIVFVGLGCPRQETWVYEHKAALSMPLIAVGAAFDFIAGKQPQAPMWMQNNGLEWLFRLSTEPRRLWRRYVMLNPAFLFLLACQAVRVPLVRSGQARRPKGELRFG